MNIWNKFLENIKAMLREAKKSRAIARADREEIRLIERGAYHEERKIVAVKEGKARARQPRGIAGISAGVQSLSKNIEKIAPPSKGKKYKGQTMDDVLGINKTKGKSMLDMKF